MNHRIEFLQVRYHIVNSLLEQYKITVLTSVFASAILIKISLLFIGAPGTDLTGSDIPKSLMLLRAQNPYPVNAWSAPYPPFLLLVDAAIIWLTGSSGASVNVIASNIRAAGLVADLGIGLLIYLTLRARQISVIGISLSLITFLFWFSSANYFFFHSDIFGMLLLAGSIFSLVKNRVWIGGMLLGLSVIFKLHPILAVPLLIVWSARRIGIRRTVPIIVTVSAILFGGLVLPFGIPGYSNSILGWNLQVGDDASGHNDLTLMNLFYGVFPRYFHTSFSGTIVNDIWMLVTIALFLGSFGFVWLRADKMGSVEVVLIGLAAWLIPLRQQHPHYVLWLFIPLLMLGRNRLTILVAGLFDLATAMNMWVLNIILPNPIPWLDIATTYFLASLVLGACSAVTFGYVLKGMSSNQNEIPKSGIRP